MECKMLADVRQETQHNMANEQVSASDEFPNAVQKNETKCDQHKEVFTNRACLQNVDGFFLPLIKRGLMELTPYHLVQQNILNNFRYDTQEIFDCILFKRFDRTEMDSREAHEFNKIITSFVDNHIFKSGEFLVSLDSVKKIITFLNICRDLVFNKIRENNLFGFIQIDHDDQVPFVWSNGKQLVPLFYFEGQSEYLDGRSEYLDEPWQFGYLQFCCNIQKIRKDLFDQYPMKIVDLNDVKSLFPSGTSFDLYWPDTINQVLNKLQKQVQQVASTDVAKVTEPGEQRTNITSKDQTVSKEKNCINPKQHEKELNNQVGRTQPMQSSSPAIKPKLKRSLSLRRKNDPLDSTRGTSVPKPGTLQIPNQLEEPQNNNITNFRNHLPETSPIVEDVEHMEYKLDPDMLCGMLPIPKEVNGSGNKNNLLESKMEGEKRVKQIRTEKLCIPTKKRVIKASNKTKAKQPKKQVLKHKNTITREVTNQSLNTQKPDSKIITQLIQIPSAYRTECLQEIPVTTPGFYRNSEALSQYKKDHEQYNIVRTSETHSKRGSRGQQYSSDVSHSSPTTKNNSESTAEVQKQLFLKNNSQNEFEDRLNRLAKNGIKIQNLSNQKMEPFTQQCSQINNSKAVTKSPIPENFEKSNSVQSKSAKEYDSTNIISVFQLPESSHISGNKGHPIEFLNAARDVTITSVQRPSRSLKQNTVTTTYKSPEEVMENKSIPVSRQMVNTVVRNTNNFCRKDYKTNALLNSPQYVSTPGHPEPSVNMTKVALKDHETQKPKYVTTVKSPQTGACDSTGAQNFPELIGQQLIKCSKQQRFSRKDYKTSALLNSPQDISTPGHPEPSLNMTKVALKDHETQKRKYVTTVKSPQTGACDSTMPQNFLEFIGQQLIKSSKQQRKSLPKSPVPKNNVKVQKSGLKKQNKKQIMRRSSWTSSYDNCTNFSLTIPEATSQVSLHSSLPMGLNDLQMPSFAADTIPIGLPSAISNFQNMVTVSRAPTINTLSVSVPLLNDLVTQNGSFSSEISIVPQHHIHNSRNSIESLTTSKVPAIYSRVPGSVPVLNNLATQKVSSSSKIPIVPQSQMPNFQNIRKSVSEGSIINPCVPATVSPSNDLVTQSAIDQIMRNSHIEPNILSPLQMENLKNGMEQYMIRQHQLIAYRQGYFDAKREMMQMNPDDANNTVSSSTIPG